ncbi:vWA domain-containing protein [Plastoroseomonas arctica]|uniref:VWA domain-containing protein n=1 Tax=Plastoroseomonas arctica TaxID=1509237 RepID=A0AAF1JU16_9PROT|nr:VWA domain-containing protein [Plastoroseomonas arctica]MBR0653620.1 VWA domain-containing protein [Plastoroseomonas arctica]
MRAVVVLIVLLLSSAARAQETVIIFDASGSMWGRIDGRTKIEIAREAARTLYGALPPGGRVGLMAYGHRRANDCGDIEMLVPLGALDAARLAGATDAMVPRGRTPITESLRQAATALDVARRGGTVILVTDGIETCEGDPCALAAELERSNAAFTIHVVGFDLRTPAERARVSCLAERTGGRFIAAQNASELGAALRQVAAARPAQVAAQRRIPLVAMDGPRALDGARFAVTRIGEDTAFLEDVTGDVALAPGRYRVAGIAAGRSGAVEATVTANVPARIVVPITLPVPTATLTPETATPAAIATLPIAWRGPDEPGDVIAIIAAGATSPLESRPYVATRAGNPAAMRMPATAGDYELRYLHARTGAVIGTARIAVQPFTARITAPDAVEAGTPVAFTVEGPTGDGLWLEIGTQAGASVGNEVRMTEPRSGEMTAPTAIGEYELRYVDASEGVVLARRPLRVVASSLRMTASATARTGYPMSVAFTGTPTDDDWIGVVAVGTPDGDYVDGHWLRGLVSSGSPVLLQPLPDAGAQELRYVRQREVLQRVAVAVSAGVARVEAPARALRGAEIALRFEGPAAASDYLTFARAGDPPEERMGGSDTYLEGITDGRASINAPAEPGSYELRYVSATSRAVVLARVPVVVE